MGFYKYINYFIKCVIRRIVYSDWFWKISFLILMVFVTGFLCNNIVYGADSSEGSVYGSISSQMLNYLYPSEGKLIRNSGYFGAFFKMEAGFIYNFHFYSSDGNPMNMDNIFYLFTDTQPGVDVPCSSLYAGPSSSVLTYECTRDTYIYFLWPISLSNSMSLLCDYYENTNFQLVYDLQKQVCEDVASVMLTLYKQDVSTTYIERFCSELMQGNINFFCKRNDGNGNSFTIYRFSYNLTDNPEIFSNYFYNLSGIPSYSLYSSYQYNLHFDSSVNRYNVSYSGGGTSQTNFYAPTFIAFNNYISCFQELLTEIYGEKEASSIVESVNTQTNVIENQTQAIENSSEQINDNLTSTEYDENSVKIDTSAASDIDDSSSTGLFTTVFNNLSNLISNSNWTAVEVIEIGLPYVNSKIELRSDILSKIVGNSLLKTLINVAWYSLFGLYVFRFVTSIYHSIKSGNILNGINFDNEVISSTML